MALPTSIPLIQDLLERYGARPQKRFGQNFLTSRAAVQKILSAQDISQSDTILEIGPGLGALTFELANRARRVIAVEKDRRMAQILRDILKQARILNVEVVQKDARDITTEDLTRWGIEGSFTRYKLVANLPYYIATPIIRKFLEIDRLPKIMVCTIQKEVAQRICAKPPHMNVLALSVQFYADPEIVAVVPNSAFWPKPEVDGAIVKITPRKERPDAEFSKRFFKVIKAGFSQPRKKLISNLERAIPIPKEKILAASQLHHISDNARAQSLELPKWIAITKTLATI